MSDEVKATMTMGFYEARTRLSELLTEVERGKTILITRRGRPVAVLTAPPHADEADASEVVAEMLRYRDERKRSLGKLEARALIEEGRRY
jgi:antitoxin (DNA-binding transcriptional repressor) of toxin-antitoxin stability system